LHRPDVIRQRLQGSKLPPAGPGTNMLDALGVAISMFSGSAAELKRIVLITDGMPNPGQADRIKTAHVQAAKQSGIQIFAIGLSMQVEQAFLDAVTQPTGGRTLIAPRHQLLLQKAKQLIGDQDNISILADQPLASGTDEYAFNIPPGIDRARVTAILDHPRDFTPGDLTISLSGPPTAGERPYTIQTDDGLRLAAWTAFFSTPGTYTLGVRTTKPGGHKGLRLFIETLSNLRLQLTLNPPEPRHVFDSELRVLVQTSTSSGSIDPASLTLTGVVQTADGGSRVIAFTGSEGTFRVPDVKGRQTVIIRARTAMNTSAEARLTYEAIALDAGMLVSVPDKLAFAKALGPTDPAIQADLKLVTEFPEGVAPRTTKVGFILTTPVGEAELATKDGATIKTNGPALLSIPPGGVELTLRIKFDPNRPLPKKGGWHSSELRVFSNDTAELTIPFRYQVRIPAFAVRDKLDAFTLWWDPAQPRTVSLGSVHTDLEIPSTFTVTLADSIIDPHHATKIADVTLHADGRTMEAEPAAAGKLRFGPIDLQPGRDVDLQLVVTPHPETGWQYLAAAKKPFEVELASSYGMSEKVTPVFYTLGPPLLGRVSRYGRPWVAGALVVVIGIPFLLLTRRALGEVRRFWRFRPGSLLTLGFGDVRIGGDLADGAALVLPNSGSPIDDTRIGEVRRDGRKQRIQSDEGYLVVMRPALAAGDEVIISDDPEEQKELWGLQYVAYDTANDLGEIEVQRSPARWTIGRLMRSVLFTALLLFVLLWTLRLGIAASAAYGLPLVETFYLQMLR
ncbi:MAG TPA: vWA domain-containing protein, partial [Thermoanaerobaculia bacterium]|nr:vWA domain-containing protein [Thermoanaerobaculia bacterium]